MVDFTGMSYLVKARIFEQRRLSMRILKLFSVMVLFVLAAAGVYAQQRYALVIGNGNYNSIRKLENPVNDATDISAKLRNLGYQVDLQTNVTNVAMARAVTNFVQRLSQNRDNEGFFWFAGHAVQINGENYLLPIDVNSANEVEAVHSSYAAKRLVDSLDQIARNKVNVVVLDACRDNPFVNMPGSFRNVTRGLTVIQNLPTDLLIFYSTAAGAVAQDGPGQRNSPFTQAFLQNMDSNEDIQIVFRTIARETMRLTNNNQRPFDEGSIISQDYYSLNPRKGQPAPAPRPAPAPVVQPVAPPPVNPPIVNNMVRINGGTFQRENNNITVSSFYMGKYEVTQKEYQEVMGTNPSNFKGDNLPVECVSWFDAVEYCNKRSQWEGLTPAYTISGSGDNRTVTWNRSANGYRLPTEAEWEYACRAGTTTAYNTGDTISDNTGWYSANSDSKTHEVGKKPANAWGLYDMHGNVVEWCWDWYGDYSNGAQTDPTGASSGSYRVGRGGYWGGSAALVRSTFRGSGEPGAQVRNIGFRLARNG
jgi:formylglycine-generating enzyme required for sulfatase activity